MLSGLGLSTPDGDWKKVLEALPVKTRAAFVLQKRVEMLNLKKTVHERVRRFNCRFKIYSASLCHVCTGTIGSFLRYTIP